MITRHYKRIVKDILQRGGAKYDAYAVTASNGRPYYTAQEQPNYSADQTAMSMSTDQPGVIIGSGTAAESETSYWLAQQITSGFTGSVLPTHEMVDGTHTLCLYVTIANTGNSSITISEIGYALITPLMRRPSDSQFVGSPYPIEKNVLIDRTVLAAPITIAAGNSVRLKYALKTTDEIFSGSVVLIQKTINVNGVYNAISDNANGYSEVTVSVTPNLQSKTVTQNGTVTPDQGYDGLSSVVVNVSGGGSGVVLSGTTAPTSSIGNNEDLYVQYSVHAEWDYLYRIDALYRKVNGAWVDYVEPTDPNMAVHVWTQSTSGSNAAMYVQQLNYDPTTGNYTPVGDAVIVVYTEVRGSATFNLFNLATLGYPNDWAIIATGNITDGTNTYSSGDTVATWRYSVSKDIYLRYAV